MVYPAAPRLPHARVERERPGAEMQKGHTTMAERATDEELDQIYNRLEEGEVEEALKHAEALVNRYPRDSDSLLALAAARLESELPRLALETVVRARDLGVEDTALALGIEGSAHYELGEFEMAKGCFEEL